MKRRLWGLLVVLAAAAPGAHAQHFMEITASFGYMFGGGLDTENLGRLDLRDDGGFALTVDVNLPKIRPGTQLEIGYIRQETEARLTPPLGNTRGVGEVSVNYFQIGGLWEFPSDGPIPFLKATVGVTYYVPETDANGSNATRFSFVLGVGGKIRLGNRVGLRLEGDLLSTLVSSGSGIGIGEPLLVASGGSLILQGLLTAGVTVNLGG